MFGKGEVKPEYRKAETLKQVEAPKAKKFVLAGYYHRFIPHFSIVTQLLTDLMRNNPQG